VKVLLLAVIATVPSGRGFPSRLRRLTVTLKGTFRVVNALNVFLDVAITVDSPGGGPFQLRRKLPSAEVVLLPMYVQPAKFKNGR